jgi:hypothetical protein
LFFGIIDRPQWTLCGNATTSFKKNLILEIALVVQPLILFVPKPE